MSAQTALLNILYEKGVLKNDPRSLPENSSISSLARTGILDERQAINAVAKELSITALDLEESAISNNFDFDRFQTKISPETLWRDKAIPLYSEAETIHVAFANPLDYEAKRSVEFALGTSIKQIIAAETQIVALLARHFPKEIVPFDCINDLSTESIDILNVPKFDDERVGGEDKPPIIALAKKFISEALDSNASDIHIEPHQNGLDIRLRIDGVMRHIYSVPKRLQPFIISRYKLLAGMDIAEKRKPQDGRMRVRAGLKEIDVRVSSVPTTFGEKLVFRLLDSHSNQITFSALGFPSGIEQELRKALTQKGQMILVSGPTGSGKTTTLYSCLVHLRDGTRNIETVENPVEYRIPGISQIQVNEQANVTFSSALRSILRQDPDVIMIGEIRDSETADIAIQAAQTGHLVLSTLHTNDAISAITRLHNLGCRAFSVASALSIIIAQRLVRKLCTTCAQPASQEYLASNKEQISHFGLNPAKIYMPIGCPSCNNQGYKGRTSVLSMLKLDDKLRSAISREATFTELALEAQKNGFQTLGQAATQLLYDGVTSLDEIAPYLIDEQKAICEQSLTSKSKATAHEPTIKAAALLENQQVLLVEDDEDTRAIIKLVLQKDMYEVIEASNGYQALELLHTHNPDLIISDLMMPTMDGREFLRRLRTFPVAQSLPVIMLTAIDSDANEVDLITSGANDFVSKTSSPEVLLARIRRLLKK